MQGVAILMNSEMQLAWRRAGSYCDSHGGRLIHVKLELQRRIVHVISVYAPTFNTEATEKDDFYDSLRGMLGNVKSGEEVVVMGDFNARVGFRAHSSMSGEHHIGASDAVGSSGMGHLNDNGERLLGLCEGSPVGLLKVAGAFFRHAHYGSWMHARTKQWQHIDHVLAPIRTMRMVLDVKTMPGIGFDTDHRMIRSASASLRERGMVALVRSLSVSRSCKSLGWVRWKQIILIRSFTRQRRKGF